MSFVETWRNNMDCAVLRYTVRRLVSVRTQLCLSAVSISYETIRHALSFLLVAHHSPRFSLPTLSRRTAPPGPVFAVRNGATEAGAVGMAETWIGMALPADTGAAPTRPSIVARAVADLGDGRLCLAVATQGRCTCQCPETAAIAHTSIRCADHLEPNARPFAARGRTPRRSARSGRSTSA
jgi:hypothetical protein